VKLADSYGAKPASKCREDRFFTAFAIAADVDDQIVRLSSIPGGQEVITHAAIAIKKMKDAGLADHTTHPYNWYPFGLNLIGQLTGINGHDEQIRELLNLEFSIKFEDKEFLRFVKYLTAVDPTYPGWSKREKLGSRDFSVSKKKFREAYVKFKRTDQKSARKE
jgi:hypothetical protein